MTSHSAVCSCVYSAGERGGFDFLWPCMHGGGLYYILELREVEERRGANRKPCEEPGKRDDNGS